MSFIFLSIATSSILFVIFKLFDFFKINSLHAIIYSYIVAASCGFIAFQEPINIESLINYNWFYYTLSLGVVFITVFYSMAITTQRNGLSIVAVSSKMSLIIPAFFGVLLYNEKLGLLKIIGIILALISVYLVTKSTNNYKKKASLFFPIIVFLGSGLIDTSLKYLQTKLVPENEFSIFSSTLFGAAATIGVLIIIFQLLRRKFDFEVKNIIAGIILGFFNYYSIIFLIKALTIKSFDSTSIFTFNNIGILLTTTLLGVILFKEKLSTDNKVGMLLAVIGIALVSFASNSF